MSQTSAVGFRDRKRDSRIVVLVNFVVAGLDIDGDEFAVILRPERRPHLPVENISPESGEFIEAIVLQVGVVGTVRSSELTDGQRSYHKQVLALP